MELSFSTWVRYTTALPGIAAGYLGAEVIRIDPITGENARGRAEGKESSTNRQPAAGLRSARVMLRQAA
jgi:hypothetical protein